MSISSVTSLAYAKAVPAAKWLRLIEAVVSRQTPGENLGEEIAECLLRLLWPLRYPSSILMSYLRAALHESLVTPTALSCLILRSASHQSSGEVLRSLCALLLEMPLPLYPETFPAEMDPIDLGSTASSSSPPSAQPVLGSLTQLIQTSLSLADVKVTTILTYMVANLPVEAPPLQVALAAAELLPALQAQGAEPLHRTLIGVLQSAGDPTGIIATTPTLGDSVPMEVDIQPTSTTASVEEAGPSILLAAPMMLLVEHSISIAPASTYVASTDRMSVNPRHPSIIKTGSHFTSDGQALLHHLIEASVRLTISSGKRRNDNAFCFAVSGLSDLVQYWRDGRIDRADVVNYPEGSLSGTLAVIFKDATLAAGASAFDAKAKEHFGQLLSETEGDDDDGFLDEQRIKPLFVLIAEGFVARGLMTTGDADGLGLTGTVEDGMDFSAIEESFASRICRAHKNQIPAFIHRLLFTPSLHGPFANDVLEHLRQAHDVPPPDGLLSILTSHAVLLHIITQHVAPSVLSHALVSEIITAADDPSSRAEDPQGCLTRYGEAVILNELIEHLFGMQESLVSTEASRTKSLPDLSTEDKTCLNGWVKALFGPDGIEDEVLFATSPPTFLRLSATLIQQSIAATKAKVIDIDTLRGGLSYFAQPLLSWCTGRVVTWLCEEIPRQGLLSAIHLDVLQTLVLSSGFPEPVLKMIAPLVTRVLRPGSGLEPVIQSANIDTTALLSRVSTANSTMEPSDPTYGESDRLRADLQLLLHPELSSAAIPSLSSLAACASRWSPSRAVKSLLIELSTSSAPVQLRQRLALVAMTATDAGDLLSAAIHTVVPELLQRESFALESVGPIAGYIAKALGVAKPKAIGQDLIAMLVAYASALSEGQSLDRSSNIGREGVKSLMAGQRRRLQAFVSGVCDVADFMSAYEGSDRLRKLAIRTN